MQRGAVDAFLGCCAAPSYAANLRLEIETYDMRVTLFVHLPVWMVSPCRITLFLVSPKPWRVTRGVEPTRARRHKPSYLRFSDGPHLILMRRAYEEGASRESFREQCREGL